ncbi:MAG: hypothetical protein A2542_03960 [Parcubacteria group bacterium RIFOXYD2_FULL_52_8]|nr:MAG: hypothetical protein A2542_03960 [Parcubacteria group bacterium RIFOXYD2_FULL_52_8]
MKPKEEGHMRFTVAAGDCVTAGESLTATAIFDYRDLFGAQQITVHNFVPVRVGGVVAAGSVGASTTSRGLNALFGTGFLPQSLLGWLLLLIVIIILVILGRRAMRSDTDTTTTSTTITPRN